MSHSAKDGAQAVKKFGQEFRDFISRGNVVDLAVGVIIGGAFGKIIASLVSDIIMPLVGAASGGLNFRDLAVQIGSANIAYGSFIQQVVDFLIIAACIFLFIKLITRFRRKKETTDTESAETKDDKMINLLTEIRDNTRKGK